MRWSEEEETVSVDCKAASEAEILFEDSKKPPDGLKERRGVT